MDTLFQKSPLRARYTSHSKDLFCVYSPLVFWRTQNFTGSQPADIFLIFRAYDRTARKLKGHPHSEVPFRPLFLSKLQTRCQHAKTAAFKAAQQTVVLCVQKWKKKHIMSHFLYFSKKACTVIFLLVVEAARDGDSYKINGGARCSHLSGTSASSLHTLIAC